MPKNKMPPIKPESHSAVELGALESREDVIRNLRQLHLRRMPLNLTTAKRLYPQLVRAVYEAQPFWGWRQALEDAGIEYDKIQVELQDFCVCLICGAEGGVLTSHLIAAHQITPAEYLKEFPNAEIVCDATRAAKTRHSKGVIPHWEPLWSLEYALDRLARLHHLGHPLNSDWASTHEPGLLKTMSYHGYKWDDMLRDAGLDPLALRLTGESEKLTKEDVVRELQARQQRGDSLAHRDLLREHLALCNAARRKWGSHNKALRAAGINPADVRLRVAKHTDALINRFLARVRRAVALPDDAREAVLHALEKKHMTIIYHRIGNWQKVAQAAGVPGHLVKGCSEYTLETYPLALRKYQESGGILSYSAMKGKSTLYGAGCRLYGSFRMAVQAAGLEMAPRAKDMARTHRTRRPYAFEREELPQALKSWKAAGNELTVRDLKKQNRPLYRAALHWHGTLGKALIAAGLAYPHEVGLGRSKHTRQSLLALLYQWQAGGGKMGIHHIMRVHGRGLAEAFQRVFGGFHAALQEAELQPVSLRKHTQESVVAALRRWGQGLSTFHTKDFLTSSGISYGVYWRNVGPWNRALQLAGLRPEPPQSEE